MAAGMREIIGVGASKAIARHEGPLGLLQLGLDRNIT
jgi:hypothetical protein